MTVKRYCTIQPVGDLRAKTKHALTGGPFGSNLVSRDYTNEGVPVIRGCNLTDNAPFSFEDLVFVSEKKADALRPNNAFPGDLVFTQRGTLGQVGLIPQNSPYPRFIISQSQMKLTVDPNKADTRYLYYYFRLPSTVEAIHSLAISSGVPHINLDILRKFQVITPPVRIQRKIAAILSAYDELIENNKRRIALLEKMAEEIYREWFVRLRFPGYEKVRTVKGVPEGWQQRRISDFAQCKYGYTESAVVDESLPKFLRVMDINKASFISWLEVPNCPIPDLEFQKHKLSIDDVVIARMADPGKVAIIERDVNAIFASYLIKIAYQRAQITPYYLFYTLRTDAYEGYFSGANSGATRGSINGTLIGNTRIVIPNRELLEKFENVVRPIRTQLNNLVRGIELLSKTRDRLLPRLISGKLSVENLDIQFPPGMAEEAKPESSAAANA